MKVNIKAPDGKKLRHVPTGNLYSEVVVEEKHAADFVVADSDSDPLVKDIDGGVTLADRVSDLEDAVVELAEIITEV